MHRAAHRHCAVGGAWGRRGLNRGVVGGAATVEGCSLRVCHGSHGTCESTLHRLSGCEKYLVGEL